MQDLRPIHRVVDRVRLRLRLQAGLNWGVLFAAVGLLLALGFGLAGRLDWLAPGAAAPGVWAGLLLGPLGFFLGWLRPVPSIPAAKQIDLTHQFNDRLSSALDFARAPEPGPFEQVAIREALALVGKVKPSQAAPLSLPKDTGTALALAGALVLLAAIQFPREVAEALAPVKTPIQALVIDEFDLTKQKEKALELLQLAKEEQDPELEKVAKKLLELWEAVERGELTQEEALKQLAALEKELSDGAEAKQQSLQAQANELAKALEKNKDTKALAKALAEGDLQKAAEELQKLAEAAEKMSPDQREQLKEALEKAAELAEEMERERELAEQSPEERERREEEEQEERERELDRCAAFEKDDPERPAECSREFSEEEEEERRRELEKDKRDLEQLRRDAKEKLEEERQKQREREQLSRDLRDFAEKLDKAMTEEQKQAMREAAKQAAEKMKEQSKYQKGASRSKSAKIKIADAKDLVIRSGGKGKGQQDDFRERAGGKRGKGQKGQGEGQEGDGKDGKGRRPGQGQNQGKDGEQTYVIDPSNPGNGDAMVELPGMGGQGDQPGGQGGQGDQPGGQGDQPGGDSYGEGSQNPFGEETSLDGASFRDEYVEGKAGNGPSAVEVIGRASQQGLAGAKYQKVYREAQKEAEESLEREKIPVGYKRFVKRYFDLIQPQ